MFQIEEDGNYELFRNGKIEASFKVENDEIIGAHKTHYPDGNLREMITYTHGSVRHGLSESYYPNKQLKFRGMYHLDDSVGEHIHWFENGAIDFVANFDEKGRLHGKFLKYYENGNLAEERNYHKDKFHEEFTFYRENGDFWKRRIYRHGNLIKTVRNP